MKRKRGLQSTEAQHNSSSGNRQKWPETTDYNNDPVMQYFLRKFY